jgi:hypothetical protein
MLRLLITGPKSMSRTPGKDEAMAIDGVDIGIPWMGMMIRVLRAGGFKVQLQEHTFVDRSLDLIVPQRLDLNG